MFSGYSSLAVLHRLMVHILQPYAHFPLFHITYKMSIKYEIKMLICKVSLGAFTVNFTGMQCIFFLYYRLTIYSGP